MGAAHRGKTARAPGTRRDWSDETKRFIEETTPCDAFSINNFHGYNLVSGIKNGDQFPYIDHPHGFTPDNVGDLIRVNGRTHNQVNIIRLQQITSQAGSRIIVLR